MVPLKNKWFDETWLAFRTIFLVQHFLIVFQKNKPEQAIKGNDAVFICLIFGVVLGDSRTLWQSDIICFWFEVYLRGSYVSHLNVWILRFDKSTTPYFQVRQNPRQFWYNCEYSGPEKNIIHLCIFFSTSWKIGGYICSLQNLWHFNYF